MQNFIKEAICSLNASIQKCQLESEKEALREIVDFSEEHLKKLAIYQEKETALLNNFKK
jgi:hypothetical protein